jgi:hypothetical protein
MITSTALFMTSMSGIEQERRHDRHVDLGLRFGNARESGLPHQLVGISKLLLQRLGDIRPIEAREHVDDVHLHDRILAVHARHEVRHVLFGRDLVDQLEDGGFLARLEVIDLAEELAHVDPLLVRREDLDDGRLRHVVLAEQVDEAVDVVALVRRKRPRRAGHGAGVRIGKAPSDERQRLVVDEAAQQLHVLNGLPLVGRRERFEDLRHGPVTELGELLERFLGGGGARVRFLPNLRDEAVGLQCGNELHRLEIIRPAAVSLCALTTFKGRRSPPGPAATADEHNKLRCAQLCHTVFAET